MSMRGKKAAEHASRSQPDGHSGERSRPEPS
jgi:hypothetical protein